jgi:hypothetical protein
MTDLVARIIESVLAAEVNRGIEIAAPVAMSRDRRVGSMTPILSKFRGDPVRLEYSARLPDIHSGVVRQEVREFCDRFPDRIIVVW